MKKLTTTLALLAATLGVASTQAASAPAKSAVPTERYYSIQGAIADVDGLDSGLAISANYGMPIEALIDDKSLPAELRGKAFFEAEASTTVVKPSTTVAGIDVDTSYFTAAVYGVYRHTLRNAASVHARLGLVYANARTTTAFGSGSDSTSGIRLGVGMLFPINKAMNFRADYTVVSPEINHLSVGVQIPL